MVYGQSAHTKKKPPKQNCAENKVFVFTVGSGDNTRRTEIDWVVVRAVCVFVCGNTLGSSPHR